MEPSSIVPCDCCGQPAPRTRLLQEYGFCAACANAGCCSKRDGAGVMLRGVNCILMLAVSEYGPVVNCLQCGRPLHRSESISFVDNTNESAGGCHARCVDAWFASKDAS